MVHAKYHHVVDDLRQRIASGELAPGARLPTWSELSASYAVGRPTLMRAMALLREEGFVVGDSTRASYVAATPPCHSRIGIVFGSHPGDPGWNAYWQITEQQAAIQAGLGGWESVVYHQVDTWRGSASTDRLREDLSAHRLAGLVIASHGNTNHLVEHLAPAVPAVQLGGTQLQPGARAGFHLDIEAQRTAFAAALRAAGVTRIAVLSPGEDVVAAMDPALAAAGIGGPAHWRFALPLHGYRAVANTVRTLLDAAEPPDGLLITDDNLVPGAAAGLMAAGVEVGRALQVVAHRNWPAEPGHDLPFRWVGFDLAAMFARALAALSGPAMDAVTRIAPVTAPERVGGAYRFERSSA